MTTDEYKARLNELTEDELHDFNTEFGGGQKTRDQRVREYVSDPKHERRLCQLLGLKTEDEKLTEAALQSATAAAQSASSARVSVICSAVACVVSIIAVIVAIISLFVGD